jgi:hypothetical protein
MTRGSSICQSYVLVKASLVTCKTMVLVRLGVIIHATHAIAFLFSSIDHGALFFKTFIA